MFQGGRADHEAEPERHRSDVLLHIGTERKGDNEESEHLPKSKIIVRY